MKTFIFILVCLFSQALAQPAGKFGGGDAAGYARAQFNSGLALMVELSDFSARAESDGVRLQWRTDREWQNSHFEVEHRVEGHPFVTIGWLAGAGNRQEESYYDFVDYAPAEGRNYYRIKDVDWNGRTHFSEVREIYFSAKETFHVFANEAGDYQLLLPQSIRQESFQIQVFSPGGQEIWSQRYPPSASERSCNIQLSGYAQGLYIIRLVADRQSWTQWISRQ